VRNDSILSRRYKIFRQLVDARFRQLLREFGPWTPENKEWLAIGVKTQAEANRETKLFEQDIAECFAKATGGKKLVGRSENPLFWNLRNAFVESEAKGLSRELRYAFQSFALRSKFAGSVLAAQHNLADLRHPMEWHPATRTMQRTIHLHVGPTNSGKTYQALKALESANSGLYAGPLRLLAHEIYTRFQAKGLRCALITGEEQRIPEGGDASFQSCTVEMTPLNKRVDVAVIDEIQMIADDRRGWAWTQAFLGVQAREVHLCGEERAVDIIKSICQRIGDKCVVHRYQRLSPLQTMPVSLKGDFSNLRKGDALVSFSRVNLHQLKAGVEKSTGRRCAIVYGSLPPETRAQQAALFNDPDNDYDYLVASDAIGMGLNLEIKRIIFESVGKNDGHVFRKLHIPEIRQIGGRAGRYRTAAQAIRNAASGAPTDQPPPPLVAQMPGRAWGTPGFVTTLEEDDLGDVQEAFQNEAEPIRTAGISAPAFIIEKFSAFFPPSTPMSHILLSLRDKVKISSRFHLCNIDEHLEVADIIEPYDLSITDRCTLLSAPASLRDIGQKRVLEAFAKCIAEHKSGHLLDFPEIDLEVLDAKRSDGRPGDYLRRLEALHKAITLYLWLSYRYVGVFVSQNLAFHVKSLVEEKITDYLEHLTFVPERMHQRMQRLRELVKKHGEREEALGAAKSEDAAHAHGESLTNDAERVGLPESGKVSADTLITGNSSKGLDVEESRV